MFQVEWLESALDALARFWANADSGERRAITAASQEIDKRLARSPETEGESRSAGNRITIVLPLAVVFHVESDRQTVVITLVRLLRHR